MRIAFAFIAALITTSSFASEKEVLAAKIRKLTPGSEQLIEALGLEKK